MKKQASDQYLHDRRYQERKRAEAAKQSVQKKNSRRDTSQLPADAAKEPTKQ